MRAFRVSVRILRLPRNSMRSTTACVWPLGGCCAAWGVACWLGMGSGTATESAFGESEEEARDKDAGSADADGPARRFFCVVAGELAARDRKNAAIQVTRNAKTPNGKQTLL